MYPTNVNITSHLKRITKQRKRNHFLKRLTACHNGHEANVRVRAGKDCDLMPGLARTKASSSLHILFKTMQSSVLLERAKLWAISVFSADSQTTKLVGADWPGVFLPIVSPLCCVAPVSPRSPHAISLLEGCLSWHYRILLCFVRQPCLHKPLHRG